MTKEERGLAIGFFKLRRRIFCDNHLKNCPKNSNEYIATLIEKSFYDMAIKALEQETVLDKIRAEIETERNAGCHTQYAGGLDFALSIIDKYKAESEVAE